MTSYPPFSRKKRTTKSRYRGALHSLRNLFYSKRDVVFTLKNVPLTYWVGSNTIFSKHLTKWDGYEAGNSNWVLENFSNRSGGLFVDVGANFGWYSLLFSLCAASSGRVVAIEPEPGNLRLLHKNIVVNNAANVFVIASGVGADDRFAELSLSTDWNPGMHSLRDDINSHGKVKIEIRTLDRILKNFPGEIDLLKMDIEGFEIDALMGASETLARTKHVLIEFTPKFIRACGHDPRQLLDIFENHKFVPHVMNDGKLESCDSDFLMDIDSTLAHQEDPQIDIFYVKS